MMPSELSAFQTALILSLFPSGAHIQAVHPFQPEYPPSPLRVDVVAPENEDSSVVLRLSRHRDHVATEATLLGALGQLGLPVPTVLAGPVTDPDAPTPARSPS